MPCNVFDYQGNGINSQLEQTLFEDFRQRKEFYTQYIQEVGKIVGFVERSEQEWARTFNKVQEEFNRQSFLHQPLRDPASGEIVHQALFGSFAQFFDLMFVQPYGISCQVESTGIRFINGLGEIKDKQKQKIITFNRGINLPELLCASLEEHLKKQNELSKFNEIIGKEKLLISAAGKRRLIGRERLEGILKAEFSDNYWSNIFSQSDDCIFLSHNRKEEKLIFQDYWVASLLHMFHPSFYYLNFVLDDAKYSKEMRKIYPYPIAKAILIDTADRGYPLLVEGVLGNNLRNFRVNSDSFEGGLDFIDYCIWLFFERNYRSHNSAGELLYFPNHTERWEKLYYQFDERTKAKYRSEIKTDSLLELAIPLPSRYLQRIANLDNNGQPKYDSFQFSEAFAFSNPVDTKTLDAEKKNETKKEKEAKKKEAKEKKEARVGGFVKTEGHMHGISAKSYVPFSHSAKKRLNPKFVKIAKLALATFGLAGLLLLDSNKRVTDEEYLLQENKSESYKGQFLTGLTKAEVEEEFGRVLNQFCGQEYENRNPFANCKVFKAELNNDGTVGAGATQLGIWDSPNMYLNSLEFLVGTAEDNFSLYALVKSPRYELFKWGLETLLKRRYERFISKFPAEKQEKFRNTEKLTEVMAMPTVEDSSLKSEDIVSAMLLAPQNVFPDLGISYEILGMPLAKFKEYTLTKIGQKVVLEAVTDEEVIFTVEFTGRENKLVKELFSELAKAPRKEELKGKRFYESGLPIIRWGGKRENRIIAGSELLTSEQRKPFSYMLADLVRTNFELAKKEKEDFPSPYEAIDVICRQPQEDISISKCKIKVQLIKEDNQSYRVITAEREKCMGIRLYSEVEYDCSSKLGDNTLAFYLNKKYFRDVELGVDLPPDYLFKVKDISTPDGALPLMTSSLRVLHRFPRQSAEFSKVRNFKDHTYHYLPGGVAQLLFEKLKKIKEP